MKRMLLFFVPFFFPLSVYAISASSYTVMDYDSGRILESYHEEEEHLIASTTKIMTAIIALENGHLEEIRKVGEEVLSSFGSAIYLNVGEEISLKDLLYGLMLRSGNDAAIEIAYLISGNMDSFVAKMNEKAYSLGMSHTQFINAHGLENDSQDGNISTAKDMAVLMRYALKNPMFREIIHTKVYEAETPGKKYVWQNKNKLLKMDPYQIGGKTGYTKKAGRTLVTASQKDEKTCIVVTLQDSNDFSDHQNLCTKVFQNYQRVLVLDKNQFVVDPDHLNYYIADDFYALLTEEEKESIRIDIQIHSPDEEEVGVAEIYLKDQLLGSEKIYQKLNQQQVKNENFLQRFLRWLFRW